MLALETFERLSVAPIATKSVELQLVGAKGELAPAWVAKMAYLDKHEQYRQVKSLLSELLVADIDDELRFTILESAMGVIERLVVVMQQEYINNPQSPPSEQKTCVDEVRSLYFLLVLCYQGIAFRTHKILSEGGLPTARQDKKGGWLTKLKGGLSSNVVRNGVGVDLVNGDKRLFVLAVYRIMSVCYRLLMEFALTYQKSPASLWKLMNGWYLKSAILNVDKVCVSKISSLGECSIYQQYLYSCLASFANFFAYRRPDIINGFKVLPIWAKYVKTTFTADGHLKLFVNLQGATAPELITPYASVNPYSSEHVCLFFEVGGLFDYLNGLETGTQSESKEYGVFEKRLAKMVMLAFQRQADSNNDGRTRNQAAEILVGFGSIFKEIAGGKPFNQIIAQSRLPDIYAPKRVFDAQASTKKELVKLMRKNDAGVQFMLGSFAEDEAGRDEIATRPLLPIFGLFAMKSQQSTNKHPWRLAIVHWAQTKDEHIEVDGRFLGRLLSVCGVRLNGRDLRSKDFMQALLVAGDGLNQQTTLIIPRYHFKEGDLVILRVEQKETSLRLEKNLLSTDDIEQYQIVRLT